MFDIGMVQVLMVGGAAMLVLGKKDMPVVFRFAGRAVGRISGLIQGGRARMAEMSKGSELLELQNEIRSNLDDLRTIRSELVSSARMPASITSNSHPGSRLLKTQHMVSASPAPPTRETPFQDSSPLAPAANHSGLEPSGSTSTISGDMAWTGAPTGPFTPIAGVGAVGGGVHVPLTGPSVRGDGGGGGGAAAKVKRVASAGGDRLQQLAMAEAQFTQQGLYNHKTHGMAGGADILNDTITDSLLQERYQTVVANATAQFGGKLPGDFSPSEGSAPPREPEASDKKKDPST